MRDWYKQTVLSQYANSPIILGLIESFNSAIDPSVNIDAVISGVLDVTTAQGFALDIWGRIVGVDRTLYVPVPPGVKPIGFRQQSPNVTTFGHGTFYSGSYAAPNFAMDDATYRRLILTKAFANISDRSIHSMNAQLLQIFPGSRAYVTDAGSMTVRVNLPFAATAVDRSLVLRSGAFLAPAGVLIETVSIDASTRIGFRQQGHVATFQHGSLYSGSPGSSPSVTRGPTM